MDGKEEVTDPYDGVQVSHAHMFGSLDCLGNLVLMLRNTHTHTHTHIYIHITPQLPISAQYAKPSP